MKEKHKKNYKEKNKKHPKREETKYLYIEANTELKHVVLLKRNTPFNIEFIQL